MSEDRPLRRAIPKRVKIEVRLRQKGYCGCRRQCGAKLPPDGKGLVEYQHTPALALREVTIDGSDYIPCQHNPNYIIAELKACHGMETNGSKATSYGSDKHAIAKTRRLRGELKPRPKPRWVSRSIQSRPFQKRPKP